MRFSQPLDQILGNASKVRILRFLCRKGGEWSGRRIAAELGLNPVTAHAALRALHLATVLEFRKVGNSFVYSLRDDHYLVRQVLRPLFEQEAQTLEHLRQRLTEQFIAKVRGDIVTVALYGSVARGQERPTSDLDLVVLVVSERAKAPVRAALDRAWESVVKEFGNPLAAYVSTVSEARQKYRRGLPLWQNILAHHQPVWGQSLKEALGDGTA